MIALPDRLVTRRLVLRPIEERDIPDVVRALANWDVASKLGRVPHPYVARHARGWIATSRRQRAAGLDFTLGIALRSRPQVIIGAVGAHNLAGAVQPVGYWLAESCWGEGYISEALRALLAALLEVKPDASLEATSLPDNHGSIRVLEKAGFRRSTHRLMLNCQARGRKMRCLHFTFTRTP